MRDIVKLDGWIDGIKSRKFHTFIDKLSFLHILVIWLVIIIIFGLVYHYFDDNKSYLFGPVNKIQTNSLMDSIYFSFITATSTGFGDIIPYGSFKMLSIFEVVFGLLLLALVTSKLVSIKQDIILGEIYDISLNERINRLRSSFLLFRQNVGKTISRLEEGFTRKREINDLYNHLAALEDDINETIKLVKRQGKNHFTKDIDSVSLELILNSVLSSFEKLNELFVMMNQNKMEWKKIFIMEAIDRCLTLNDKLFNDMNIQKNLKEKVLQDFMNSKDKINNSIKESLKQG